MISNKTLQLANKLWDYHHMHHALEKADCILTLGSHDLRVAERAAQLYLEGWAPIVIFSGGLGNFTKETWTETEADRFAAIAISMGVPEASILVENKGIVISCDKEKKLSYSHLSSLSRLPDKPENYSILEFVLTPVDQQTLLTLFITNFQQK